MIFMRGFCRLVHSQSCGGRVVNGRSQHVVPREARTCVAPRVARFAWLQYLAAISVVRHGMRRWLGGIAAFLLCAGTAAGGPADCGAAPDAKCLAAEIF